MRLTSILLRAIALSNIVNSVLTAEVESSSALDVEGDRALRGRLFETGGYQENDPYEECEEERETPRPTPYSPKPTPRPMVDERSTPRPTPYTRKPMTPEASIPPTPRPTPRTYKPVYTPVYQPVYRHPTPVYYTPFNPRPAPVYHAFPAPKGKKGKKRQRKRQLYGSGGWHREEYSSYNYRDERDTYEKEEERDYYEQERDRYDENGYDEREHYMSIRYEAKTYKRPSYKSEQSYHSNDYNSYKYTYKRTYSPSKKPTCGPGFVPVNPTPGFPTRNPTPFPTRFPVTPGIPSTPNPTPLPTSPTPIGTPPTVAPPIGVPPAPILTSPPNDNVCDDACNPFSATNLNLRDCPASAAGCEVCPFGDADTNTIACGDAGDACTANGAVDITLCCGCCDKSLYDTCNGVVNNATCACEG